MALSLLFVRQLMRHNAEKMRVEDFDDAYPDLRIVEKKADHRKTEQKIRPETMVLGWEPRRQRLASLRSAR